MTMAETKVEVPLVKKETENGNAVAAVNTGIKGEEPTMEEKVLKQVEFYFGDANLPNDKFIKLESAKHDGWFPAELLLKFNKIISMVSSVPEEDKLKTIIAIIQSSVLVEVNEDSTKIRRNPESPLPEGNAESKTIYLKGFNKTETHLDQLIEYFSGKYEGVERVIMRYYKEKMLLPPTTTTEVKAEQEADAKPKLVPASTGTDKIVWVKKFKGSIFVVFKTEEQAKAALRDISTFGGHPLMKLMQADYVAMKKKEYQERVELRNAKKRKTDGADESPVIK